MLQLLPKKWAIFGKLFTTDNWNLYDTSLEAMPPPWEIIFIIFIQFNTNKTHAIQYNRKRCFQNHQIDMHKPYSWIKKGVSYLWMIHARCLTTWDLICCATSFCSQSYNTACNMALLTKNLFRIELWPAILKTLWLSWVPT